jgi:hypothetical protein
MITTTKLAWLSNGQGGKHSDCEGIELMFSAPNPGSIFGNAITEHLLVVRQLKEQQGVMEAIARAMTATLWSIWLRRLWGGFAGSVAVWPQWHLPPTLRS